MPDHGSTLPLDELAAPPVAVLEVERAVDRDRQLEPLRLPRERQQRVDEPRLLGPRGRPPRNDEHVEVALRPQPAEDGRAEQVGTDDVGPEHLGDEAEEAAQLLLVRVHG